MDRSRNIDAALIVTLYHDLCDMIEIINSSLTFPLILVVIHFFVLNLFAIFSHIWIFTQDRENFSVILTTDGVMILLNWFQLCILAHTSTTTTREAEETAVIVSRIVNKHECSKHQQKILKNFLLQNQYRNLKLRTPLFDINWKLLLSVSRNTLRYSH